ncbi:neuroblastoma breakpoint family member 3-like isoform X1 [Rhinopithecus roxellana]|uniref:neuroblastoma breakpoint family member 3-like isoform X1 n=2 Tax=Rhinopithecus roxellana TaxID=61622 RepID=UPI0012372145|nr:neuroblastoma breakpoint family member 3-like isoform X1 [Rhinopithecus roxellana]
MCLGFFSPVPDSTSSATNISMVVSAGPWSNKKAEMNTLEINEKLRSQRTENKHQFLNTKEKYLVTQLAYFLAKGQNTYKYEECKDLLKSMLRDELQFKEEKLAEQLRQAEELRKYKVLVHSQERELSLLREKLREGRGASRALNQHLQALLTPDEPLNSQGRDLRGQLAEGCRLAQHLVQKLTPENDEDEDEDVNVEEAEKVQESCAPREVRKAEEKEVPEDSVEDCAGTSSNSCGPSESNQPHKNCRVTFEEDQVDSTLLIDRESSPDGRQDALNPVPVPGSSSSATNVSMVVSSGPCPSEKSEMNTLEINEKLRPQRAENKRQFLNTKEKCLVTQLAYFLAKGQNSYNYEECKDLLKSTLRDELQFKQEKLAEQLGQAEELRKYKVLVHSQERELSQLREKLQEGRDASRALNQHLQALLTPDEPANSQGRDLREQLAEGCRRAQHLVQKLTPENDEAEDEDVNVEDTEEVRKAEEKEVPEDSVEDCAGTSSNSCGPSESNQPHQNCRVTFEEDQVDSTLLIDRESSPDGRQDALNLLPVPGSSSSATNVSMVVSSGPWSSEKSEMNTLEIKEKLCPQRAENKRQFLNTKEKFLVTQLAYFLAKGQNSYNYEECKDLLKSMLRDELQFKEEKLAEQLGQAEELRQYKVLVHSQERELSKLREKLREGRDASRALNQHLQALLTPDEPANSQGRDLREQLAEGCRLAQHLVRKLTLENDEAEDEDVNVEETEKVQEPCAPREVQKAEEKEESEDSLDEYAIACSNSHGPCESNQPHSNTKITFEEDQVNSCLIDSSSHDEWEDAVFIIPENESDHEEEEEKGPVSPRNLQESEEEEAPQESWDEGYLTLSIPPDMSASYQSYRSTFHSLEEQQVDLALDVGRHWCDEVKKEDQEATGPRLNTELLDEKEPEVLQDSLDRFYSTPCGYLELPDLCQPYRNAFSSLEEQHFGLALDMDRITKDQEEEEDQGPPCPRLSRELLDVVEPEVLQDSLDRCYSTPYSYLERPDSCHPHGGALYSLEEQHVGFSLGVDEIEKYQGEEEDQNPPCPRLNEVLMEAGEPEVLQDSLSGCYSTPSSYFQLPDSFQHYTSAFYSLEEQHVSLALDVDNGFSNLTVIRFHLGFQMGVIFPH